MPHRYELKEESIARRKTIIALCEAEPMTMKELSAIIGLTPNTMRHSVNELLRQKHIKIVGTKPDENKRECFAYLSTDSEYMPHVATVITPTIQVHVPQVVVKKENYKPVIIQETSTKRTVYLTNNVKTKGSCIKRDVRIGSTLGSYL
jgi:predicted transcriptional regulator